MKLEDFLSWLDSYLNFEKTQTKNIFWLDSMKFLCEKLGNPQNQIPCIHVAGSKGKGSVSQMLSKIMEKNGKKCGLYQSPHIIDFRERIRTSSEFFEDQVYENSADQLVNLISSIKTSDLPGQRPLTWFELVTVFAFLCFKNAACDFVIYETGLGGRLDSTNVVNPLLSVITPIEKEHTEFLGDTIEKIAGEKAGIIKDERPVIVSLQNYNEAEKVFYQKSLERNSRIIFVKDYIKSYSVKYERKADLKKSNFSDSENNISMHLRADFSENSPFENKKIDLNMKMFGNVQAENALLCLLAIKFFFPEISYKSIIEGIEDSFLPGRFEIHKNIILDGAHTVKSVKNTLESMKNIFPEKKYILLFACAGDKDFEDIILLFKNTFKRIVFTDPESVRHSDSEKNFLTSKKAGISSEIIKNTSKAFNSIISQMQNDDILLVTGSFYLVSEIKSLINKQGI